MLCVCKITFLRWSLIAKSQQNSIDLLTGLDSMSRDDFMGKAWLEVSDVAKGSGPGEEQEITLTLGDCPMENPGMIP